MRSNFILDAVNVVESFADFTKKFYPPPTITLVTEPIQPYLEYSVTKLNELKKNIGTMESGAKTLLRPDSYGRTAMHIACHSDNFLDYAKKLVDLGADVNATGVSGFAPLHIAAWKNSVKIAELLIENHAVIDICGYLDFVTPLYLAVVNNSLIMVKLLLNKKANANKVDDIGRTALHIAVVNNSMELAKILIKNNPKDINTPDKQGMSPLLLAVSLDFAEMAELLLRYEADVNTVRLSNQGESALHVAVRKNSFVMTELLLKSGARPNIATVQQETPLHWATFAKPNQEIIELLLMRGALPNSVDINGHSILHFATYFRSDKIVERILKCPLIEVDSKDKSTKMSPLHLTALFNLESIAQMLIEKKANVNAEDYNRETPLEYAASTDAYEVAELLLKNGATARCKRWKLRSPLHIAAAHNAKRVAELLISKGADVRAIDDLELTPLHYAHFRNHKEFVKFLQPKFGYSTLSPLSKQLLPDELAMVNQLTSFIPLNNIKTIAFTQEIQLIAEGPKNESFRIKTPRMQESGNGSNELTGNVNSKIGIDEWKAQLEKLCDI